MKMQRNYSAAFSGNHVADVVGPACIADNQNTSLLSMCACVFFASPALCPPASPVGRPPTFYME